MRLYIHKIYCYYLPMCYKCGKENSVKFPYGRNESCEHCGADLHCCKNCKYFSPGAHYDCHETIEEPVFDKERSNFCDFFKPNDSSAGFSAALKEQKAKEEARKAFNSLWGD